MQFLLDAQLSRVLARHLEQRGFRASHIFEHLRRDAEDQEIAEFANRLGACIITKDADFVDIARRGLLERTLIWLRIPNMSNAGVILRVDRAMPAIVSAVHRNIPIAEIHQD